MKLPPTKRYCLSCDKLKIYEFDRNIFHSRCEGCGNTFGVNPNNAVLKHFLNKKKKAKGKANSKVPQLRKKIKNQTVLITSLLEKIKRLEKMQFKKGEITKESINVIMHDLECLELKDTEDNKYHYDLLKGNLKDIFGIENER